MLKANNFLKNDEKSKTVFDMIASKSSRKCFNTFHDYMTYISKQIDEDRPFNITNLADIFWKVQLWKEKLPNVTPYYAVKANADPVLIRLFNILGYGFDCSTEGEIKLVMEAGADPQKIIFAQTMKARKALKYASSVGVHLMTFDSKEELLKIKEEFPTARLILRLKSENVSSVYNLSIKFGCESSQAEDLLLQAKSLNLNVVGVSFHVGALCENPVTYTSTIKNSRLIFDLAENLGFNFSILDIGAGFFGSKKREDFFLKLTEEIKISLEENFPGENVEFIAEPGCFCVASAVSLITRIIGKKSNTQKEKSHLQRQYYLNDGYYGSFSVLLDVYDIKPVPLLTKSEMMQRSYYKSKIWGQTCCSEDIILEECLLPDMYEGEFIVWENMGAYRFGINSAFTIVPYPANQHVFIQNPRLNLNCISNLEEVINYISKVAELIEHAEETHS